MKRFRVLTAALCAAVLLCGFSVPAYAYAGGGEYPDYDEFEDDGPPWDEEDKTEEKEEIR